MACANRGFGLARRREHRGSRRRRWRRHGVRCRGQICQVDVHHGQQQLIVLRPRSPLISHTHHGKMWGYLGNLIKVRVKVVSSTDTKCAAGTAGTMTMFGSYNGVRSDSIQFRFPAACAGHDHMYHGPQVDAQVPPP